MSAHRGSPHFVWQRLTAVALVPLVLWFVLHVILYTGAPHEAAAAFLAQPLNAGVMALFVAIGLWHAQMGLQVVIEDYVSSPSLRSLSLSANIVFHLVVGVASLAALAVLVF